MLDLHVAEQRGRDGRRDHVQRVRRLLDRGRAQPFALVAEGLVRLRKIDGWDRISEVLLARTLRAA